MTEQLPLVNAILNSISTIFIIISFNFIKKGNTIAHRNTMVIAFITSALFLISYITYHYSKTMITTYNAEGILRYIYFFILISHSALAIAVPPLVISAMYLGFKGKLTKHRKVVKYAYPIWLYVSFTGVLVYVILHHFNY